MTIVLHQFASSHFNEKARWALDYKDVAHRRESYLPGPHLRAIKRLSGQTATPVLTADDQVISGSAAIIEYLEQLQPEPALYPGGPNERQRALDDQSRFDAELGPAVRTIAFAAMLPTIGYVADVFGRETPLLKKTLYRGMLPFLKGLIAKANRADSAANIAEAEAVVQRYINELSQRLDSASGRVYLVDEAFSVADLTAAALLAPLVSVSHPDMARPDKMPAQMRTLVDRFAQTKVALWVQHLYAQHRPVGNVH